MDCRPISRYKKSQIKAAVKVNQEMLKYYWELGRDVVEMHVEDRWGEGVINCLSRDLKRELPNATGLSRTNIYYAKNFYLLYSERFKIVPQLVGQFGEFLPQLVAKISSSQPIGISEYELVKFYPEKIEGTIPTIEEIEKGLEYRINNSQNSAAL